MVYFLTVMNQKQLEDYLLAKENTFKEYPFEKHIGVYKVGPADKGVMFTLIDEKSDPLRISLRCEPKLAKLLRERYETVMPGINLNKQNWNTVILSGQLSEQELIDLINLAYQIAVGLEE